MTADQPPDPSLTERDPFLASAEIALRRAGAQARRRSVEPPAIPLYGPDSMMGGLTQQEIGDIRRLASGRPIVFR